MKSIKIVLVGILISFALTINGLCKNNFHYERIGCPDIRQTDIFYVHAFLTFNHNKNKRKDIGLRDYDFDKSEIGAIDKNTPQKLRKHWKTKNVYQISDPQLCAKISKALDQSDNKLQVLESMRVVYFIADDRYMVFYRPKKAGLHEKNFPTQVLDDSFELIKTYDE